ncbi:MAG: ferredoxin reductase [Streptosporangiaceae bacterium]|nr:ferredoxin reductase [Streptosporangiaceae bacterium]MBV9853912.1 ferredoxin reductase [Streptosporangiaceae bacterium]
MARAAVLGRLTWQVATLTATRDETATAKTLVLDVPGWPGHLAGQHVDVRLTAPDGYTAERSYSIASPPDGDRLELTVQRIADGEVSPYLTETLEAGDQLELRGPIGGWFVWDPDSAAPVLLVAGGSGVVPLMSMIRARARAGSGNKVPFRLIYSVRTPADALYADELTKRARDDSLGLSYVYTRMAPPGGPAPGRISATVIASAGWPARSPEPPAVFVCGPTGFVEAAARLLIDAGHAPARIKTERFGPTGT